MAKIKRLQPEDRDNLVAYLDGELPEQETHQIDRMLSSSNVARHEIEMLTRTWEMLDLLPREKASDHFTQTTMQTVRLEGESKPRMTAEQVVPQVRLGLGVVAWLGGLIAASWIGFMLTQSWTPNEADQLIDNLPVVKNFNLYQKLDVQDAEKMKFLRELQRSDLFNDSQ